MRITNGVYRLPLTFELEGEELTHDPTAIETDRGVLLVDAGWPGAVEQLEAALEAVGINWIDVWAVLLTDQDVDHVGGLADLVERWEGDQFTTSAGAAEIVFTPGHAPGHISLYFEAERLLLSGDALHAPDGELTGPRAPLDESEALESIDKLSELDFERTLCYHGGFVEQGAEEIVVADEN